MESFKILEIRQSVFASNDEEAAKLRAELKEKGVFLLNLMSSPGSGKTTTLTRTIEALKDEMKIGVMEADIDSDVDARAIAAAGAKSIQLHTGGMCHLDAGMTRQGLDGLGLDDVELAILENVGNLVCPAEFDTGMDSPRRRHSGRLGGSSDPLLGDHETTHSSGHLDDIHGFGVVVVDDEACSWTTAAASVVSEEETPPSSTLALPVGFNTTVF